ncbi:MAG: hypothetical protein WDM80_05990 [Limisphaerales bacterium]
MERLPTPTCCSRIWTETLATTRGTLTNADVLINNAGSLVAPDSIFNAELINLLQQGGGAAQSLRVLADLS